MKKVLIVDDEFLVRLGLRTTLDWNAYGYEIVGEARNTDEALEVMKKNHIDILMTDIKMQGQSGLDLIEKVKTLYPHVKSVILTNHDDFSFARRAIELGAEQYILKSEITPVSLLSSLTSITTNIDVVPYNSQSIIKLEEKFLDEQLLKLNIHNDMKMLSLYSLSDNIFTKESYFIITGYCAVSQLTDNSVTMLSDTIINLSYKFFDKCIARYVNLKDYLYIGIIYNSESSETLEEKCTSIIKSTKQYFNTDIHFGISNFGTRTRFEEMFAEAEKSRLECFFGQKNVCSYSNILNSTLPKKIKISTSTIKRLVDSGTKKELENYIRNIFADLKKTRDYSLVKNAFIDLLSLSKSLVENYDTVDIPGLNSLKFEYNNLYSISHIDNVELYIIDVYEVIWNFIHRKKNSYSSVIKSCMVFVENNYSENITLENAAQYVNISSSYLSFIFKQETGINFSSYLTNFRIEKSKELILKSNLKIYEIADKVGFSSPYYFSKVFKEITNMTCKEFKNNYT